jgi:hypothetical protein
MSKPRRPWGHRNHRHCHRTNSKLLDIATCIMTSAKAAIRDRPTGLNFLFHILINSVKRMSHVVVTTPPRIHIYNSMVIPVQWRASAAAT